MSASLFKTWIAVVVATVAVLVACVLTLRSSVRDVFPRCQGAFATSRDVFVSQKLDPVLFDDTGTAPFRLEYRETIGKYGNAAVYTDLRFVATGPVPTCGDAAAPPWPSAYGTHPSTAFSLYRDRSSGAYVVKHGGDVVTTFVRVDAEGHRFMPSAIFA